MNTYILCDPFHDEEGVKHEHCDALFKKAVRENWEEPPCCTCFPHADCDLIPSGQEVTQEAQREIAGEEVKSVTDY